MIDECDGTSVDVHLGIVSVAGGGAAAGIEIDVGQTAFNRRVDEIEAAPVAGRGGVLSDVNALGVGALGHDFAGAVDSDGNAGGDIDGCARVGGGGDAVLEGGVVGGPVRSASQ